MTVPYYSHMRFLLVVVLCAIAIAPFSASAASTRPTCVLKVVHAGDTETIRDHETILVRAGDKVRISWQSKNATSMRNESGERIALSGSDTVTVGASTTYTYTATKGSRTATCSVTAEVVAGTVSAASLSSHSSKPTLAGTALGVKTVQLKIAQEGSDKTRYTSKTIKVKNGAWSTRVSKKLSDDFYTVTLFGSKGGSHIVLATSTLAIGQEEVREDKAATTLVVDLIPLLFGGTARANQAVPVSYLQMTNVGKEPAILRGFWVKQNGSAPAPAVARLTTIDDAGGSQGASLGAVPFKDGRAFAPTNALFAPGQMRLFTIKAVVAENVSAYIGTQLMIDVLSLDTNASVKGQFPIRGTTWTIAR